MAERLHPGVYVEEVSSGVRPIEGVSTSTGAFVGVAARGIPGRATLVSSFDDYVDTFGGHMAGENGYLPLAVEAFFRAGGRRAYVVRVLPSDSVAAEQDGTQPTRFSPNAGTPAPALQFYARGNGDWADYLRVEIGKASNFAEDAFRVDVSWVEAGAARTLEVFDDIRMDPDHDDYFAQVINEGSRYIRVTDEFAAANDANTGNIVPIPESVPRLQAKSRGTGERYQVYEGATLEFTWTDSGSADPPRTTEVEFGSGLTYTNGVATITRAELRTHLETAFAAASGGPYFRATQGAGNNGPFVEPNIATRGRITVSPAASWPVDLTGETLTFNIDGTQIDIVAATEFGSDVDSVSQTALANAFSRRLGAQNLVDIVGDDVIVRTRASSAGTAPTLTQGGSVLTINAVTGVAGEVVESLDGITLTVSEAPNRNFPKTLRDLDFPTRVRGYEQNSPANPLARPTTTTTPIRLVGGYDGTGQPGATDYAGDEDEGTGLHALDRVDVNIVAMPGRNTSAFLAAGISYCDKRGDCFFLADGPGHLDDDLFVKPNDAKDFALGLPNRSKNAAMFYPWLEISDPVGAGRNPKRFVPPSGHVAGIFARTDINRGVWKAPAGLEATVSGAIGVQYELVDAEQDILNPVSLNCIRRFPGAGIVSWGSRTLSSDPEWRYVPVRRTALFLKESLRRGLQWAVFEPNDQELWDRIRINIESFMLSLFRQGAFQGSSPDEAYTVICDRTTNPQALVDQGVVTARVAFAPLKPAEFVVIEISQKTLVGT